MGWPGLIHPLQQLQRRLGKPLLRCGRRYNVRVASRYFKGPELLVDLQVGGPPLFGIQII